MGAFAFPAIQEPGGTAGNSRPAPVLPFRFPAIDTVVMDPKHPRENVLYCTVCKRICTERGHWVSLEMTEDPETEPARFCLSLCPECAKKIYPRYYNVT
jgi:hypothetical protein